MRPWRSDGVLRSDDAGENWRLVEGSDGNPDLEGPPEPLIYPDVHSIAGACLFV